eukprot:Skav218582  [mRNA]  locus=scaffold2610:527010:537342:- [translate_table: standard]
MIRWNVAWLVLLAATVSGRKLGFQTTYGFGGESGRPAHLTFKLKAVHYANPKAEYAELGHLQISTSKGICLTCSDDKVCSSPSHPAEASDPKFVCSEAKAGKKFSWRVKSSAEDESDIVAGEPEERVVIPGESRVDNDKEREKRRDPAEEVEPRAALPCDAHQRSPGLGRQRRPAPGQARRWGGPGGALVPGARPRRSRQVTQWSMTVVIASQAVTRTKGEVGEKLGGTWFHW